MGDIRVDAFHPGATVKADFFHLPFKDGSIGTIISDPPWNLNTRERIQLHRELARVLRVDGRLLWQATWLPNEGHFEIERIWVYGQRVGLPRNARILVRAHRRKEMGKSRPQLKAAQKRVRGLLA
jgi:ubiquinone/menaquinone biosynthesis C-methylase UbiE